MRIHYGLEDSKELRTRLREVLGVTAKGRILPEGGLAWKSYDQIAVDLLPALGTKAQDAEELSGILQQYFFEEVCVKRTAYPTFSNLPALMGGLCDRGIFAGLATTDTEASAKVFIERLGIAPWISFCAAAGMELPEKPDGGLIRIAARKWGIRPEEIAVVGDTPSDMRFAHNGGAFAIGVLSGTGGREELEGLADAILASVDGLLPFLDERRDL